MTMLSKIIMLALLIAIIAGAAYFFVYRGENKNESETPTSEAANIKESSQTEPLKAIPSKVITSPLPAGASKPALPSVNFPKPDESPDPSLASGGPVIITKIVPGAVAGKPYSVFVTASGGSAVYSWKMLSGGLPPGISLLPTVDCSRVAKNQICHSSLQISGTPEAAGAYNFRIAVSDGAKSVYKDYSIAVTPADLKIVTQSLPDAKIGVSYSAEITGTGGTGLYAWSLVSGNLSSDFSLVTSPCSSAPCQVRAIIVGTPRGAGNYNFAINLASGGQSVSKIYSLAVKQ